jgi:hypothetical protein
VQFERRTEASASARLLRPDTHASEEGPNSEREQENVELTGGTAPANQLRLSFAGSEDGEAETETCRAAKPLWRTTTRTSRPFRAQLAEPPYADPHVRWCGRGGRATVPPMPIFSCWSFLSCLLVRAIPDSCLNCTALLLHCRSAPSAFGFACSLSALRWDSSRWP